MNRENSPWRCRINNIIEYIHVLTVILRDLLKRKIPPEKLQDTLNKFSNKKVKKSPYLETIKQAAKEKSYNNLDISALYTLLRNFTDIPKPTKGWGTEPISGFNVGDDIERIRNIRNFCSHWGDLSQTEFEEMENDVVSICERMTLHLGGEVNYAELLIIHQSSGVISEEEMKARVQFLMLKYLTEILSRKQESAELPNELQTTRRSTPTHAKHGAEISSQDENKKKMALKELKLTCSKKNLGKPKSILLVGPIGVGKSSFINSSIAAINGEYHSFTQSGRGSSVTAANKVIQCSQYGTRGSKTLFLPTFVDMIGLDCLFTSNEDEVEDWLAQEVLAQLIDGELPENTDLLDFAKKRKDGLIPHIPDTVKAPKIDIILMAWAPKKSGDTVLNDTSGDPGLDKVIKYINKQRSSKGREIPVFVVLTKMDECNIEPEDLKNRKHFITELLQIEKSQILECVNYIDPEGWNEKLDSEIPILEFLNKICGKGYERKNYVRIPFQTIQPTGNESDSSTTNPRRRNVGGRSSTSTSISTENSTEFNNQATQSNENSTEFNNQATQSNENSTEFNNQATQSNENSTEFNSQATQSNEIQIETWQACIIFFGVVLVICLVVLG